MFVSFQFHQAVGMSISSLGLEKHQQRFQYLPIPRRHLEFVEESPSRDRPAVVKISVTVPSKKREFHNSYVVVFEAYSCFQPFSRMFYWSATCPYVVLGCPDNLSGCPLDKLR